MEVGRNPGTGSFAEIGTKVHTLGSIGGLESRDSHLGDIPQLGGLCGGERQQIWLMAFRKYEEMPTAVGVCIQNACHVLSDVDDSALGAGTVVEKIAKHASIGHF
jgi:hypothetical protein